MKTIKRRRKENRTNYLKRINLLKSEKPRVVFRKTNKYLIAQYVTSKEAQDSIRINTTSKELLKYGWPEKLKTSLKNTSAAYLLGLLIASKIKQEKLQTPIIDFGLQRVIKKSKMHTFIKGLVDAGIDISHKKEFFPPEKRIKGEHIKEKVPFEEIKSKITKAK